MTLTRLVWIVAVLVAIQACSPGFEQHVDRVSAVEFDGRMYDIGYASDLRIGSQDLVAVGALGETHPLADGVGVFALGSIDPRSLMVMKALPGEGIDYLIGFARGSLPEAAPDETEAEAATRLLTAIPGLCDFHVAPPPGAC